MLWKKIHKLNLLKTSIHLNKNYGLIRGNYGIKSLNTCLLKYEHLECVRRRISKQFKKLEKKRFKIYVRACLWQSYTTKPALSRMGKGAGPVSSWITFIKSGLVLIEILSLKSFFVVKAIVTKALKNFPIKTIFISKVKLG